MYNMQHFFDHPKLKKNTLEIYKCWWGVSDLLWEDGVSWADIQSLENDRLDVITMEYNTFLYQSAYKLKHYNWALWNEKHLTQYICGLPWDYLTVKSYDEFKEKLVFGWLEEDHRLPQIYNDYWLPLIVYDLDKDYLLKRFTSFS